MRDIKSLLPNWQVSTTEARGINGDYMEAMAFAWLAHRNIHKLPSSLPEVTEPVYQLHSVSITPKTDNAKTLNSENNEK